MKSLKVAAPGRREWGKEGSGDCTLSLAVLQDLQNSIHTLRRRLKASAEARPVAVYHQDLRLCLVTKHPLCLLSLSLSSLQRAWAYCLTFSPREFIYPLFLLLNLKTLTRNEIYLAESVHKQA